MALKIEAGKYYRTRDGRKVGPMVRPAKPDEYPWHGTGPLGNCIWYRSEGGKFHGPIMQNALDLIAEWTDEPTGPVRTVTRKEIVPGVYGRVEVTADGAVRFVWARGVTQGGPTLMSAPELRAAAAVLTELADALGEQP